VLPDSVDEPTRWAEMTCRPAYAAFLADELLPWAATRLPLTDDPARTVVAGQSLGGLTAAHAALSAPHRFGNALVQSGSFWWPDGPDTEWLTREIARIPRLPVRFRLSYGEQEWVALPAAGAKGPRVYDWAAARLPAIDDFDGDEPTHDRWVLARRSLARPDEIAYYLAYAPAGTPAAELVRISGARWAIEEAFQAAKNERGLDQYEVRRYPGWYRHITLAMLAHAFLAAMAAAAGTERGGGRNGSDALAPLTVAEIRRLPATGHPTPTHLRHTGHALNWSRWRRRHQATTRRCHYHRRTRGHELPPPDEASAECTPKQGSDQQ
jgi:hypothetical protein